MGKQVDRPATGIHSSSSLRLTDTMAPSLALLLWFILLVVLLRFDPARDPKTSLALWVPVTWMFINESRLPSQWFGGQVGQAADVLEEGNPLDRSIYLVLILLAIGILVSRSFKWNVFFKRNLALTSILVFALLSVSWSDFPFIALKRWFRDLGNYLAILVALSDPRPLEAVRALLRRVHYLLVPLSILLIRYYPQIGKQYEFWNGADSYVGATTSKNMLGVACLFAGLFFFWDTVARWSDRNQRQTRRIILVNIAFIAQTLWLLYLSNSATSRVCLVVGCLVIAGAHSKASKRHPSFLKWMIPACVCVYLIAAFCFGLNAQLAGVVGRDPTLTGRTDIWKAVLSTNTNWLIGVGYESFWLGPRLRLVWSLAGRINEAHNGYLEFYLNQGVIGLCLLGGLLISSYMALWRSSAPLAKLASLSLALWTIAVFYNMTEAAFRAPFMCFTFLLGTLTVPRAATVSPIPSKESSFEGASLLSETRVQSRAIQG